MFFRLLAILTLHLWAAGFSGGSHSDFLALQPWCDAGGAASPGTYSSRHTPISRLRDSDFASCSHPNPRIFQETITLREIVLLYHPLQLCVAQAIRHDWMSSLGLPACHRQSTRALHPRWASLASHELTITMQLLHLEGNVRSSRFDSMLR